MTFIIEPVGVHRKCNGVVNLHVDLNDCIVEWRGPEAVVVGTLRCENCEWEERVRAKLVPKEYYRLVEEGYDPEAAAEMLDPEHVNPDEVVEALKHAAEDVEDIKLT